MISLLKFEHSPGDHNAETLDIKLSDRRKVHRSLVSALLILGGKKIIQNFMVFHLIVADMLLSNRELSADNLPTTHSQRYAFSTSKNQKKKKKYI